MNNVDLTLRPPYSIRPPVLSDFPRLEVLDEICQPAAMRTPSAELERRVRDDAQGQRVLEIDGTIVASLYSQRIDSASVLRVTCFAEVMNYRKPNGPHMQLLGLYVDPAMRGRGFGDALIEAMLAYARSLDGLVSVVAVTRCANFVRHKSACSIGSYISRRNDQGLLLDPMLHFHESHGALIREVLPGFRPDDVDNDGSGVLIEYALGKEAAYAEDTLLPVDTRRTFVIPACDIEPTVRRTVHEVLGSERAATYGDDVPWMEMGLSSLELLEVRRLLGTRLDEALPATFLFNYGSPAAATRYFTVQRVASGSTVSTEAPPALTPASGEYAVSRGDTATANGPIAIIGMACRLPGGADTPEKFWTNLLDGLDAVGPLVGHRESLQGDRAGPFRWQGGFIDDVDCFDAEFFRVSPREAGLPDPQQRLLLEVAWEALEAADIPPSSLRGTRSGVFVGVMGNDYADLIALQGSDEDINAQYATGNAGSIVAGRVSYFFDWQGPALSIDTACSSSLVAVHEACRSLQQGECRAALAAGVNVLLDDKRFLAFEHAGMLSPEGRCRTFDASANGYVRGEGCAAIMLKRLVDAQADGDPICAVILGSAINQDGSSSGLTAPNQRAQEAVIAAALAEANVAPHEIGYLEAHGTGTPLGDPIELAAAAQALGEGRSPEQPLLIGSVKSAIGHLEAAAGIAGLIKTVLSMKHGVIPGQLHLENLNPHVPWGRLAVEVVSRPRPWPADIRRAGVSSFGFSGTNAHVVVEAYDLARLPPGNIDGAVPIVLSARNEERLHAMAGRLRDHLKANDVRVEDLAYTLQVGREALGTRYGFVATSLEEVIETLDAYLENRVEAVDVYRGRVASHLLGGPFAADEDMAQTLRAWLGKRKLAQLLEVWAQGWAVDWSQLYGEVTPLRIGLPTYPFAKERYWFRVGASRSAMESTGRSQHLHPLVHRNTSTLSEQRYSTTLTGEEAFLRDHIVRGEKVVPGVAQLEWARAAAVLACGPLAGEDLVLEEVAWIRPLSASVARQVHIGLADQEDGYLTYEIYREGDDEAETEVYSRGRVKWEKAGAAPVLDLVALESKCTTSPDSEMCYARFEELGVHYGPSFRVLRELHCGDDIAFGALAQGDDMPAGMAWPPHLLDGAVQASVWMAGEDSLALPFTVRRVQSWGALPKEAWFIVRPGADDSAEVRRHDIDIADAAGRVALRMQGFCLRIVGDQRGKDPLDITPAVTIPTGDAAYDLRERMEAALVGHISAQLLLAREELGRNVPLSEFGFDSIGFAELADTLEESYGLSLSPTVFFEHPTIAAVAEHLACEQREVLVKSFFPTTQGCSPAQAEDHPAAVAPFWRRRRGRLSLIESSAIASSSLPEPIAIIGISGCFPQAPDVDALWSNLMGEHDSIGTLPAGRWRHDTIPSITHAGVVDAIDAFDPLFFGISPREARAMDPQHRLLMTYVHKVIEDAGYSVAELAGTDTALLVGTTSISGSYGLLLKQAGEPIAGHSAVGLWGSMGPNRMSYWLDWHGPSEPIDTACSSSLVAVHRAVELLRTGQCPQAVVGGVNTLISMDMHKSFAQAGLLSSEGRCRSFAASANGYVRSEGVGMLLLKPLSAAERDGDHVYGLIKGSATNHGGSANSLTAPNPRAQADVIKMALRQAQVDPRTIGYVEAHGTGTALGDPIEVQGLKAAFAELADDMQAHTCGLGSVKSNIGHLELASGVAGMIKVILQMKHRTLVKNLHSEEINPLLLLEGSPFYVVRQTQAWGTLRDAQRQELPRRAGVSSFGFGGVNAHVLLEEYLAPEREPTQQRGPALIVLSARSSERLQWQARQLLKYLEDHGEVNLVDLAYTLQVGRDAMQWRLGWLAHSREEARAALQAYLSDEVTGIEIRQGQAGKDSAVWRSLANDDDGAELVRAWQAKGKLAKLLDGWVHGMPVDWAHLYIDAAPRRLSLPTYPFSQERYWAPETDEGIPFSSTGPASILHPLVHRNTSTFAAQRYSTTLTGDETFLRDHVVHGEKVAAGAAQLEWARAAVSMACGVSADCPVVLNDVTWIRPLKVSDAREVHIGLDRQEDGRIAYTIYDDDALVYSQGWAGFAEPSDAPRVDLDALRRQCATTVSAEAFYARFAETGLDYGPDFRVVEAAHVGEGIVVAALRASRESAAGYMWSPNLLDGALQSSSCLIDDDVLSLSFTITRVEAWGRLPNEAWAVLQRAFNDSPAIRKWDISIVDANGRVALHLGGFSARALRVGLSVTTSASLPPASPKPKAQASMAGDLFVAPIWDAIGMPRETLFPSLDGAVLLDDGGKDEGVWKAHFSDASRLVLTGCETIDTLMERMRRDPPLEHVLWRVPSRDHRSAVMGFRLVKALLALGYGARSLRLTVLTREAQAVWPAESVDPHAASVQGLIGSLAKEYAHWDVRLLDTPSENDLSLHDLLVQLPADQGAARAWREGRWYRQRLVRCELPQATASAIRSGGVVVVLGGAGGIGVALSEYLIRQHQARVVWIGRRAEDESIHGQRMRLGAFGPTPLYVQADAADRDALFRARATIFKLVGAIHGVVHAAVVLADRSLAQMDEATFNVALSAKAATSRHLAEVFGDEPLDWMMFFSSMMSFVTSPGQANYAAGCRFSDAFAYGLRDRPYPVKVMHWGYWGSVGVAASDRYRSRMVKAGLDSIEPPEGMAAVERLLAGPLDRLAFVKTATAEAAEALGIDEQGAVAVTAAAPVVDWLAAREVKAPGLAMRAAQELEARAAPLLHAQLAAIGWLEEGAGFPARYASWREHSLHWMDKHGLLTSAPDYGDGGWTSWDAYGELAKVDPARRAQFELIDATLRALPGVLRGTTQATEVLFPDGKLDRMEGIYRDHPVADYFHAVLAEQLVAYVRARLDDDSMARLRILEIGAGTGGTSAMLFERLAPYAAQIEVYTYTDVSAAFLRHAQEQYSTTAPYLRTQRLDIERSPDEQGVELGQYDVVVAANVLHATRHIRTTVRNTKALLKRHGLLLLEELAGVSLFNHLTFGLLDGWWLADDPELRIAGTPGLTPPMWQHVLESEGFADLRFPAEDARGLGQQVIAAMSDGVVRLAYGNVHMATPEAAQSPSRSVAVSTRDLDGWLRQCIRSSIARELQLPEAQLADDCAFGEFGVDSITGVALVNALNERLGLTLSTVVIFDHATVDQLAVHIIEAHGEHLKADMPVDVGFRTDSKLCS